MDMGQGATGKAGSGYYLLMVIAAETFGVCAMKPKAFGVWDYGLPALSAFLGHLGPDHC